MEGPDLTELDAAFARMRAAEQELRDSRADLNAAVLKAHREEHASYTEIGRHLGISRQRVAQIVKGD
jgi:DNA-directed RNA polymerase specialized sigma subunit